MTSFTRWNPDGETWICERHLPSVVMKKSEGLCIFSTCQSKRPPLETFSFAKAQHQAQTSTNKTSDTTSSKKTPTKTSSTAEPKVRKKPATPKVEVAEPTTQEDLCAWFKCSQGPEGAHAPARKRSKYCSRTCSNANARYQHKQRAKDKK